MPYYKTKGKLCYEYRGYDDEFRALSGASNAMLDNISLLIGRILSNSTHLKEASSRLFVDITEVSQALKGIENIIGQLGTNSQSGIERLPMDSVCKKMQQLIFNLELIVATSFAFLIS